MGACSRKPLALQPPFVRPAPSYAAAPLLRQLAALWAHGHHTNSQSNLPEIGQKSADTAHRDGGADRWAAPAVQQSRAVDVALMPDDDQLLGDVARALVQAAKHHNAHTLYLCQRRPETACKRPG